MQPTIPHPDRPTLGGADDEVRRTPCSLCGAPALEACQRQPRAEHLQRWIDAYRAGRITRGQLTDVFAQVVGITRWQLVEERAA